MTKVHSRREFINNTIAGAAFAGISGIGPSDITELNNDSGKPGTRKLKILVAGGHPGDPEYGCGGTIARYTEGGNEAVLLYLNRGEGGIAGKSGAEAASIRTAEAKRACEILRARPLFAGQIDGQAIVDESGYKEIFDILEAENPDLIFSQWPIDNHRDHRAISTLIYDAWLKLGKSNSSKQPDLYYYEVSDGEDTLMFSPTIYVDISQVESLKRSACFAHASQSPEMFYSLQARVSGFRGIECGHHHAEAFVKQISSRSAFSPPAL